MELCVGRDGGQHVESHTGWSKRDRTRGDEREEGGIGSETDRNKERQLDDKKGRGLRRERRRRG